MNKEKFGEFVCKLRKEKGMTQQDLGNKLHLTNKAISKWERGMSFPDICILQDIAQVLDVSVLELLNGERNTEISISNEVANRIIEDTVNHSGQLVRKIRRKFTIAISLLVGLLPLLVVIFSCICFYFIKNEKSLDEALFSLILIIFAGIVAFIKYGIPILGLVFTNMWHNSNFMNNDKKLKKVMCVVLYFVFGAWLIDSIIRIVINNIKI